jgi:excisionase family DNA binding protein
MTTATPVTITINAAVARYGLGRTTLYAMMDAGTLRSVKVGWRRLIVVEQADRYFAAGDQKVSA